jgi:hypothetical protein
MKKYWLMAVSSAFNTSFRMAMIFGSPFMDCLSSFVYLMISIAAQNLLEMVPRFQCRFNRSHREPRTGTENYQRLRIVLEEKNQERDPEAAAAAFGVSDVAAAWPLAG